MFHKIKIVSLLILLSTFSVADSNSTMKNDNLDVNLSTMSKEEFAKSDYIRVRFMYSEPYMTRIVCNQLCKKECSETIMEQKSDFAYLNQENRTSRSIGMIQTEESKKLMASSPAPFFMNARYYFTEHEIKKSGTFYVRKTMGRTTSSFNVNLLAGHEYEIDGSSVLLLNLDGTTSKVETSYPVTCRIMLDSEDKVFPILEN